MTIKIQLALAGTLLALALTPAASRADDSSKGMAICHDGTSVPMAGRATCSGRGGIDRAATKAAASSTTPSTAATTTEPSAQEVLCKDGTTVAHTGPDACSAHGGIDMAAQPHTSAMNETSAATAAAAPAATADATTTSADAATAQTGEDTPSSTEHATNEHVATDHETATSTRLAEAQRTEAAAGGGPGKVWVNTATKAYLCPADHMYGRSAQGQYMTEADARAQGFHPLHNKACE